VELVFICSALNVPPILLSLISSSVDQKKTLFKNKEAELEVTTIDRNILHKVLFTSLLRVPAYEYCYVSASLRQCEKFFVAIISTYVFTKEISIQMLY
jgi:hypothetical protein